ncbi:acyl-CoA dehydrogenase family protein [Dactylosporangium sp. CA-092794]|uniref:acyl-CoA dehydrogenase family protein n=1 Tax=Dactylosporangium sp. CA-092794 TaxID=3239929 RepID=UPI003D8D5203
MNFEYPAEVEQLRERVRAFLDEHWPASHRRYAMNDTVSRDLQAPEVRLPGVDRTEIQEFCAKLGGAGLLGYGIPVEAGGQGGGPLERYVVESELACAGAPYPSMALGTVAPTLVWLGAVELQRRFIPQIVSGGIEFALGYTEPNAGSDLGALRTKAVRDGDDYVISGQKVFSSAIHYAKYYWLAARTDPRAPTRSAISIFIIPADAPGLSVTGMYTMSGIRTNIVFLDDVRVPAADRVGAQNDGWRAVGYALAHERYTAIMAGPLSMAAEACAAHFAARLHEPRVAEALVRIETDCHAARLVGQYVAWTAAQGRAVTVEASAAKVMITELRHRVSRTVLDLLGAEAVLAEGDAGAPAEGQFERMYRHAPITLFTAGTNAIQRDLVAEAGLGLPRYRG